MVTHESKDILQDLGVDVVPVVDHQDSWLFFRALHLLDLVGVVGEKGEGSLLVATWVDEERSASAVFELVAADRCENRRVNEVIG